MYVCNVIIDELYRPAVEEVSAVPQCQGTKLNRDA